MVTIVGAAIGFNAALLNIITEWLADIKMGYCETGFYLNENFCCWGEENGMLELVTERGEGLIAEQVARNGIGGLDSSLPTTFFTLSLE